MDDDLESFSQPQLIAEVKKFAKQFARVETPAATTCAGITFASLVFGFSRQRSTGRLSPPIRS
jgi:hypothetical protein